MVFGRPLKRTLLNPTSGSFKRHLIERVYVPKHPPNPNSFRIGERVVGFCLTVLMRVDYRVSNRLAADWFCNWSFAVCVYIYMCKYTYIYIHTYTFIHMFKCMYVCIYVCMYMYGLGRLCVFASIPRRVRWFLVSVFPRLASMA